MHSSLEELEGLQIWSLVPNMVVLAKLVRGHAKLAWDMHKRVWLQTKSSSLSSRVLGLVAQH